MQTSQPYNYLCGKTTLFIVALLFAGHAFACGDEGCPAQSCIGVGSDTYIVDESSKDLSPLQKLAFQQIKPEERAGKTIVSVAEKMDNRLAIIALKSEEAKQCDGIVALRTDKMVLYFSADLGERCEYYMSIFIKDRNSHPRELDTLNDQPKVFWTRYYFPIYNRDYILVVERETLGWFFTSLHDPRLYHALNDGHFRYKVITKSNRELRASHIGIYSSFDDPEKCGAFGKFLK